MRTKTVYPTEDIAGLWFGQHCDFARNPQHNFYFEGDTIYSYGSHFACAKRIRNERSEVAYLVNPENYSNTTAKHMSLVRQQVGWTGRLYGIKAFELNPQGIPQKDGPVEYQSRIDKLAIKTMKARTHGPWYCQRLLELLDTAKAFALYFDLDIEFKVPEQYRQALRLKMVLWNLAGEL
jgi:hypothetical protein